MKAGFALLSLAFYCVLCDTEEKYVTKYDNLDVDNILSNERLLKNYVDCLLDQGSCTPEGTELRKNMPDAIETECRKCSAKQKEISDRIVHYIIDNKPIYWEPLKSKFDPSGVYTEKYLQSKAMNMDNSTLKPMA